MKKVEQLVDSPENGDCFRACVASLLEVDPLTLPNEHVRDHVVTMNEAPPLVERGLHLIQLVGGRAFWQLPWMIWSVQSPRYEGQGHAVVVQYDPELDENAPDTILGSWRVAWDPSPWRDTDIEHRRECYRKPWGSYFFVARDPAVMVVR